MSRDQIISVRLGDDDYAILKSFQRKGEDVGSTVRRLLVNARSAADAAANSTCDNPEHALAVASLAALMPHLAASSALLAKIGAAAGGKAPGKEAPQGAGLSTGRNTMLNEGQDRLPGPATDAAPSRDLANLLPSSPPSLRGSLASLNDKARTPRKGRR